jgi:hypothetical protein
VRIPDALAVTTMRALAKNPNERRGTPPIRKCMRLPQRQSLVPSQRSLVLPVFAPLPLPTCTVWWQGAATRSGARLLRWRWSPGCGSPEEPPRVMASNGCPRSRPPRIPSRSEAGERVAHDTQTDRHGDARSPPWRPEQARGRWTRSTRRAISGRSATMFLGCSP